MPTQWDRRDLALVVRDALQIAAQHPEQMSEDAQARAEELGPLVAIHDDIHFNVLYLRLDDGSTYRVTFVQTNPAMPTATKNRRSEQQQQSGGGTRRRARDEDEEPVVAGR